MFKRLWKKHKAYIIALLIFTVIGASVAEQAVYKANEPKFVTYDKFEKDLDAGKIDTIYYNNSEEYMRYTLLNDNTKKLSLEERREYKDYEKSDWRMTTYPAYEDFRKDALKNDTLLVVKSFQPNTLAILISLLPMVLLIYLFVGMFNVMRKSIHMGEIKDEDLIQKSSIKFSDVVGHDEVVEDVKFIVSLMKDPKLGEATGARVPKGVLFSGEPGTGKTLLAKAIAGEAGVPFIYMNASNFVEMYVGLGAKRVRELFKAARKHKPCIIFIDEIDAVGGSRLKSTNSENNQTLNALLQEMDGFSTEEGIIVIGATNTPEKLDKALVRSGRFDRKIEIHPPKDWKVRKQIFEHYLKDKKVSSDVDIEVLSKQVAGFTGADIESIVNESALITAMHNEEIITNEYIEEAIDKVVFKGNRSKDKEVSADKEIVAYHEAGHAVTSYLLGIDIARASIIGTTSGVGGAVFQQESDSQFLTDVDFLNKIKVCYGGRASESIKFNKVTTGASNDITQATHLIQKFVQRYGFDKEFGLLDVGVLEKYIDTDIVLSKFSKLSNKLYSETVELLETNYYLVEVLAQKLLKLETLSGDNIKEILDFERENKN